MPKPTIKFKQTQHLNLDWGLEESISFEIERENINLLLKISPLGDLGEIFSKKSSHFSKCEAYLERKVNQKNYSIFSNIQQNKYFYIKEQELSDYGTYKIGDVEYIIPKLSFFETHFQDCINQTRQLLSQAIYDTLQAFRWVFNLEGDHKISSNIDTCWSINDDVWHLIPNEYNLNLSLVDYPGIKNNKKLINSAIELVKNGQKEPIYHSLFREAWHQKNKNTASSIVIGIASLEIAVKQCISKQVEDANWLIENLISPPVEKLILDYIPRIIKDTSPLSDQTKKDLKDGVEIRNKVVHLGVNIPDFNTTERILTTIKNLLWQIDVWNGNDWAKNYLDKKNKTQINE